MDAVPVRGRPRDSTCIGTLRLLRGLCSMVNWLTCQWAFIET